jgi:HPt (histidine-containing phosphotransfer) domain-containing protein
MDIAALARELGLDEEDVRRLVHTFLDSTEQDLVQLGRAFSEKDAVQLRATAHHINGAAGSLELNEIAEAALAIEEKVRAGIIEDPAAPIKLMRSRLEMIRSQLSREEEDHGRSDIS